MKKYGKMPKYMHEEDMMDDDHVMDEDQVMDEDHVMHEEHMMDDDCMPMHQEHMMHMMHTGHKMPGMNHMTMAKMSLAYFRMHSDPITEYACTQIKQEGVKCAIMEAALLGLLIGMGYSHEKAHMILDAWKKC